MKLLPAALATLALAVPAALAATIDLVVHCDPPLARPLRAAAAAFHAQAGVRLRIFPTAPNAIAAQLAREIQNDVVVTQTALLTRLAADGMLAPVPRAGPWRNRMVLAARAGQPRRPLAEAACAAPDPVWGGGPDGPALLAAAGLRPAKVVGTFDTAEAQTLLLTRQADYALLHASELAAGLEVETSAELGGELTYFAVVTQSARRPHPGALLRFLASPEAIAILRANGLETIA